eukprot:4647096-Heterocapsa_arctica.AAC.1
MVGQLVEEARCVACALPCQRSRLALVCCSAQVASWPNPQVDESKDRGETDCRRFQGRAGCDDLDRRCARCDRVGNCCSRP